MGVKAPQFSFTRLQGADPTVGVEMSSTRKVCCLGDDFEEALLKALISVDFSFPIRSVCFPLALWQTNYCFLKVPVDAVAWD